MESSIGRDSEDPRRPAKSRAAKTKKIGAKKNEEGITFRPLNFI